MKRFLQRLTGWDRKTEREKSIGAYRVDSLLARAISLLPIPLWRLLRRFRSDKHLPGWHSYGHTYGVLFRKWKYRPIRLLEIGIGGYHKELGGRSLLAWQAFFPFGTIVAVDIEPKQELAGRRRRIRQLDQSSAADLATLCREEAPFDVVIDDGSHMSAHQIFTFQHIFPGLKDGGIYVVEDVQTSFWPGPVLGATWDGARMDSPAFTRTCYGYFLDLVKYINHAEFVDNAGVDVTMLGLARQITRIAFEHNLIIVWKGDNTEPSILAGGAQANKSGIAATAR